MESDLFPLDAEEARVLGCLIEKAMTTPDQYPMSLNGVRVACNQVSNRDPVVEYDETTVAQALRRLADRGLAKLVHRPGDRVVKYKHAVDAVLELDGHELSLFAVLLLRGAQTPGALRQRTTRYVEFSGLAAVEATLDALRRRGLVEELAREPGQKESRWRELVGPERADAADIAPAPVQPDAGRERPDRMGALEARVERLEQRLQRLLDVLDEPGI